MVKTSSSWLVFGGSFDPVHVGHLEISRVVAASIDAAGVLLMPTGSNPLKAKTIASPEQRLAMLRLAIKDDPYFQISEMEIFQNGPCYTIDTVDALREEGWGTLTFLVGADMLADLEQWKEVQRLLRQIQLVVACRPPLDFPAIQAQADVVAQRICPEAPPEIHVIQTPLMEISSSEIRRYLKSSESIKGLVPDAVADYIFKNRLYWA